MKVCPCLAYQLSSSVLTGDFTPQSLGRTRGQSCRFDAMLSLISWLQLGRRLHLLYKQATPTLTMLQLHHCMANMHTWTNCNQPCQALLYLWDLVQTKAPSILSSNWELRSQNGPKIGVQRAHGIALQRSGWVTSKSSTSSQRSMSFSMIDQWHVQRSNIMVTR